MRPEHEEEIEVLQSIYDGDSNFTMIDNSTFQYKYEDECGNKSFILELIWGESYPDVAPKINLDLFFNKHLLTVVKERIIKGLEEQAENNLGMSMTYTLIEWLKEEKDEILKDQPSDPGTVPTTLEDTANGIECLGITEDNLKKKKDHMTKAQKRKMWDRQTADGERARGWNWVDIVKHLSQTGNAISSND